jgi:hypothetical protein
MPTYLKIKCECNFKYLLKILFFALTASSSLNIFAQNQPSPSAFDLYKEALNATFTPLFDKSLIFGRNDYCSLLFHVNEDGVISQVQVKDCDVTGAWQQSIISAATRLKSSGYLPPPNRWEKFGVQEVIFFRSPNNGTTANPPIDKPVTSIVPVDLPRATTSVEDNLNNNNLRNQIKSDLLKDETFQGDPVLKERLLAEAKKSGGTAQDCPAGAPRLNIDSVVTYLTRSEKISREIASGIEDFTNKKSLKSEAIDLFNRSIKASNELKFWGDSNQVLGACGRKSIVSQISATNAAKNKLLDQFRSLLTQN